ncbi:hypothetical protein ABMA32_09940 [Mesorhizobium sp. VNQ89]|uniref:hypothetical protein n=1 Tax=Mesorhizobium quangtriensis TaxID=3157709 RepID=UPI0032B87B51
MAHMQPLKRQAETLEYIQSMLGQLRSMAAGESFDMLAYLIEMAHLEASDALRSNAVSDAPRQKRDQSS